MKIIKYGRIPDATKQFKCLYCGCIFEADDTEYRHKFDRNEDYYICECPVCENETSVVIKKGESDD